MKTLPITLLAFASIIALSTATSKQPDWKQTFNTCYKLLRASPEVRARHDQDSFGLDRESQCLNRCAGIITGMYDDKTGISMEQWYAWRDDDTTSAEFERFKTKYDTCAAKIVPEAYGDDYCKKSGMHFDCLL